MKWHQFGLMAVLACIFFGGRPASAQQAGATPAPPAGMHAPDPCEVRLMISGIPCDIATQSNVDGLPLQAKWSEGDFAGIERQMMAWCDDKQRYPDGRSKMMAFTNAFRLQFTSWQEWDKERDKLARWHAAAPDSLAESLVEAMYWRDYAWKARGGGYASTVPKEAWELFGVRMAMASASLQRSAAQAHACPLWYDRPCRRCWSRARICWRSRPSTSRPLRSSPPTWKSGLRWPTPTPSVGAAARRTTNALSSAPPRRPASSKVAACMRGCTGCRIAIARRRWSSRPTAGRSGAR